MTETEITFVRLELKTKRFQLLSPYFVPGPTWVLCSRHCPTLTDDRTSVGRPPKREVVITIERNEPVTRFQRLPLICDHARLVCDSANIAQLPTFNMAVTETECGGRHFELW